MDATDPDSDPHRAAKNTLVLIHLAAVVAPYAALLWGMYASLGLMWEGPGVLIPFAVILFGPPIVSIALAVTDWRRGLPVRFTVGAALGVVVWLAAGCFLHFG